MDPSRLHGCSDREALTPSRILPHMGQRGMATDEVRMSNFLWKRRLLARVVLLIGFMLQCSLLARAQAAASADLRFESIGSAVNGLARVDAALRITLDHDDFEIPQKSSHKSAHGDPPLSKEKPIVGVYDSVMSKEVQAELDKAGQHFGGGTMTFKADGTFEGNATVGKQHLTTHGTFKFVKGIVTTRATSINGQKISTPVPQDYKVTKGGQVLVAEGTGVTLVKRPPAK